MLKCPGATKINTRCSARSVVWLVAHNFGSIISTEFAWIWWWRNANQVFERLACHSVHTASLRLAHIQFLLPRLHNKSSHEVLLSHRECNELFNSSYWSVSLRLVCGVSLAPCILIFDFLLREVFLIEINWEKNYLYCAALAFICGSCAQCSMLVLIAQCPRHHRCCIDGVQNFNEKLTSYNVHCIVCERYCRCGLTFSHTLFILIAYLLNKRPAQPADQQHMFAANIILCLHVYCFPSCHQIYSFHIGRVFAHTERQLTDSRQRQTQKAQLWSASIAIHSENTCGAGNDYYMHPKQSSPNGCVDRVLSSVRMLSHNDC